MDSVSYADLVGLPVGARVGAFRITDTAGDDGVYEAVDAEGRQATLTLVERETADAPGFAPRFRREARARARVVHRNLLGVYGWGESEHGFYLATRRSGAPTLAAMLRDGPLDSRTSIRLLTGVAEGLTAAHAVGLMARALTPADIRIQGRDGDLPVLGDLGITKPQHPGPWLTLGHAVDYASPEELRDDPLVPQSNVYSLARLLCECLTGAPPHPSLLRVLVPHGQPTAERPALTRPRPELPAGIDDVVATATAREAPDRYATPIEFIRAAAAVGEDIGAPRPARLRATSASTPKATPGGVPLPRTVPVVITLLAMAAGALGYGAGTREGPPARNDGRAAVATPDVEWLNGARLAARRRLAASRRAPAQAAVALGLANVYARAAAELPRGRESRGVGVALEGARRAYAGLATAARRSDRSAYAAAGASVREAERRLDRALAAVGAARERP